MAKSKAAASSTTAKDAPTPKVVLRTYRDTDYDQVEYLYRSTQVPLVYESIRSKLWAPATWVIWFAVYSALLVAIPKILPSSIPDWLMTGIKVFATFSWAVVGFATLFISSDRIELQNRIDEAMANDMSDPDLYYLNYTVQNNSEKVRKPESEQVPSHFWVLTLDDELCGMIGLTCNPEDVQDQRKELPVPWKQFVAAVLELFRLPVPTLLLKGKKVIGAPKVFAEKQEPKTARITRWAVRSDLQACGFSTLLINRALTWAHEHGINRVYAETDECCMAAEQILTKRHGFVILKRLNLNFFGEYKKVFAVRVQQWMEKNGEKTRKVFNKKTK